MARGIFISGTDTGVGKTAVAVALLQSLVRCGVRAAGMKPVAAGFAQGAPVNGDVTALAAVDGLALPSAMRNPYGFEPPIAPHLAARDAGIEIDLDTIAKAWTQIASAADVIVVEGAGGVLVPLGPRHDMLDVPARLGLPIVLVVGMRLGCLNHALLSMEAIRKRGLAFDGWIANRIDPGMARVDDNVAELALRLGSAPLEDFGWREAMHVSTSTLQILRLIEVSGGTLSNRTTA